MADNILSFRLQDQLAGYSALFDTAPIKLHATGPDGILIEVSAFWAEALGYERQEMIGRKSIDFLTPPSQKLILETVRPQLYRNGRIEDFELDFVRKDGSLMPVTTSAFAQHDDEGELLYSIAIMVDMSEAKRTQTMLNQTYRAEAIGRLVGDIAHDFNNILMVIRGNLEFLEDDIDDAMREMYLYDAMAAAQKGAHLTQQLLSYGGKAHLRPQKIDLNRVVRDADSMLRRLVKETITFETISFSGLWPSLVDRGQLETALLNLVNNAKDAMPEGGIITIETANVQITEEYSGGIGDEVPNGRYVMLAVSDQGVGMPPEIVEQAFDPFFTTKSAGQGGGLGLSMVRGFAKQSKGTVRIYSEVGFGTTVKVYIPAIDALSDDPQIEADNVINENAPMSEVLIVENEDAVRQLLVRQLNNHGLRIAEASSGDIALSLLKTGYRPKLIITDVAMQGVIQGPKLAALARKMIEDVKIIYISGLPHEIDVFGGGIRAQDVQLLKPINRQNLLSAVRKSLEAD